MRVTLSNSILSHQIISILDDTIGRSMWAAFMSTRAAPFLGAELLAKKTVEPRRHFSTSGQNELDHAFTLLFSNTPNHDYEVWKNAKLNRNISLQFIRNIFSGADYYRGLHVAYVNSKGVNKIFTRSRIKSFERTRLVTEGFYGAMNEALFWIDKSYQIIDLIFQKYMKHAYSETGKARESSERLVDPKDLRANMASSILQSIYKYNEDRGVLAASIRYGFFDAIKASPEDHVYGQAYSIPHNEIRKHRNNPGARIETNLAYPIEEASGVEAAPFHSEIEGFEFVSFLRQVVDSPELKALMCLSGIEYPLSADQISRLTNHREIPDDD